MTALFLAALCYTPTSNLCSIRPLSNSPAAPMPPPMHIVTTTCFAPRRLPSISAWPTRRCAGHAVRMADRDRAAVDVQPVVGNAEPVAAVDHLHGERFVQLPQIDVLDLHAGLLAAASAPRTPGRCPSRPARSRRPRSRGTCRAASGPCARLPSSLITTQTPAPSENWLALPAAITPPSIAGLIFDTPS